MATMARANESLLAAVADLRRACNVEEARQIYRNAAHRFHPDKGGDADAFRRLSDALAERMDVLRGRNEAAFRAPEAAKVRPKPQKNEEKDDVHVWLAKADASWRVGRRTDAMEETDEAAKRCARNAKAHLKCAEMRCRMGQVVEAEKHAKKALEIDPQCEREAKPWMQTATLDGAQDAANLAGASSVCGRHGGTVMHLEASKRDKAMKGHEDDIPCTTWASASLDGTLKIWEAPSMRMMAVLHGHTDKVTILHWDPHEQDCLASGSLDKTARLWRKNSGSWKCVAVMEGHNGRITDLAFVRHSKEGEPRRLLITASTDKTLRSWNLANGAVERIFKGHSALVPTLDVIAHGTVVASGSGDCTARLWDTVGNNQQILKGMEDAGVNLVRFSPAGPGSMGGAVLVTCHVDPQREIGSVLIWDVEGRCGWVDGRMVAPLKSFHGFGGRINDVDMVVNQEGEVLLAIASSDGQIRCMDMQEGICLFDLVGEHDISTPYGMNRSIFKTKFSDDGNLLASVGVDNIVRIWHVEEGTCVRTCVGHTAEVRSLLWLSDSTTLLTAGNDGTIRCWQVDKI